jgi:integrase
MRTQEVVDGFLSDCKLRGLSLKTQRDYIRYANQLPILSKLFPPKPLIVQTFLAGVKTPYLADLIYRIFHAVGGYAERAYGNTESGVPKYPNFMKSVTRPRVPKQIMPTISGTELNLLAWALQDATPRDKAILSLFIDTAIRIGEAAHLQRKDIKDDVIIVHGKTGYRVVPISHIARDLLLALPTYDDGYVFHGKLGDHLKESGLFKVVKRYLLKVGYSGKQFGPQTLRRSFGRFWFKEGGDVRSLQLIYGHASPTTTLKYYAAFQAEDVIETHRKHTPIKVFEGLK